MRTPILNKLVDRTKEQVEILAIKGELDGLIKECEAVTTTICGWQEYCMSDIVIDYAMYLRALRDKEARRE